MLQGGGSAQTTPTKRGRGDGGGGANTGTPPKAAKPADSDAGPARAAAAAGTAAEEAGGSAERSVGVDEEGGSPVSPSRPGVPTEVVEAAAALVSASSGGLHVRVFRCCIWVFQV